MIDPNQIDDILSNNVGGIKSIEITDVSNIAFDESSTIVTLPFRDNSAELKAPNGSGPGGVFVKQRLTCILPKKRNDVRKLLRSWYNTAFAVRVIDNNDHVTILRHAKINHDYNSGKKKTDSNNYTLVIESIELYGIENVIPFSGQLGNANALIHNPNTELPGSIDIPLNAEPPPDPQPDNEEEEVPGSVCANIIIEPEQTFNSLSANFSNLPDTYTLEVSLDGNVVASALPYTIQATGVYYIKVLNDEPCHKSKGLYCELQSEANDFNISISINQEKTKLTANTNAVNPSYLWEFEDETGNKVVIGSEAQQALSDSGIYHLTITDGGSKSAYYLYQDKQPIYVNVENIADIANPYRLIDAYPSVSGHQFTPTQIDLSRVNNPTIQITAKRGTDILTYKDGDPTDVDEWTINDNGDYEIWSLVPLDNEDLIFKLN